MSDDTKGPFAPRSYTVGYCKPPLSSRFEKGKSGYPQGRKKKPRVKPPADTSTRELFLSLAEMPVKIRDGESFRDISMNEAVIRAQSAAALKGNPYAQKSFIERAERYRKERNAEIAADHVFWMKYISWYQDSSARLLKAGAPVPVAWPHPEDLVFDEGRPDTYQRLPQPTHNLSCEMQPVHTFGSEADVRGLLLMSASCQ